MKISYKVPIFLNGGKNWYDNIQLFDPTQYTSDYAINRGLFAGDVRKPMSAWISNSSGYDLGRYTPTTGYGAFGLYGPHFTYTKEVEELPYYKQFGVDLIKDGKFTPMGEQWARAVDKLLPLGSLATFYDPKTNQLRESWTVGDNDAHNRGLKRNFTRNLLAEYVLAIRNDQILGARHNLFLKEGNRYFYTDTNGERHWVSPEEAKKYTISKDPIEQGWDNTTYWNDYEITGPTTPGAEIPGSETPVKTQEIPTRHDKYGIDWNKIGEGLGKLLNSPDLWGTARLVGNIANNDRVYDEALKAIKPTLIQPYLTHRQVVGDEATKQAYYRRAVAGLTKASRPFTSDADRLMAYMQEARRAGDELRAQGDLADNQEIRRTSDESNQHQWANTQRRTEVANRNLEALNQANALKHNLLALKHSAQWSSIDNYLKSIEYRKRLQLERDNAIQDLIWALTEQNNLENDKKYLDLQKAASDAWDKAEKAGVENPMTDPEVQRTTRALKNWQSQYRIRMLQNRPSNKTSIFSLFGKSGMKITRKNKEDLLYKSARDVVEHFRKMSKMSSDSYNRRTPKIEKLAEHPKGTKKYQLGGLAPFTIYTPVALGGETSTTSELGSSTSSSKSSKDDSAKDTLEFVKSLFKEMLGKGLPIDVNTVYSNMTNLFRRYKAFGNEMDTDDIALMYLQSARLLNSIIHSKEVFSKAKELVTQKGGLDEFAVTSGGLYVVQDKEGKIGYANNLSEIEEKGLNPLTNALLLYLRQTSPQLLLEKGDYVAENIISNGIGINKIGEMIKSLAGNIGSSTEKIEGISEVESNKIKAGLQILAGTNGTPNGFYQVTNSTKLSKAQVDAALTFIKNSLSPSQRAILNIHGGDALITAFLSSQVDTSSELTITPLSGRAAKGDGTNGKPEESSEGLKLDAATALITGKGYSTNIELNTGSSYAVNVKARYSEFLKHSGENMGAGITMKEASTSTLKGVLDWNKATLGGSTLNPTAYNYIVLNNGEVVGIDLPTKSENKNIPDFEMLKKLELLDDQLLIEGIEDSPLNWLKVNEICYKLLLPPKYDNLGKLNRLSWNRFAAFLVTTTEKALNDKKVILDMLGIADEQSREFYESIIQDKTKNDKYSLDSGWPIFGGKEELYQGTVFVPIKNNLVAGAISGGLKISITDATDLELRQRGYDLLKISTYKKNELVL